VGDAEIDLVKRLLDVRWDDEDVAGVADADLFEHRSIPMSGL
jgi:hypothetical protein